uniref:glycosyltransferase family 4 protein n=1 Tax=Acetatifactor sp. TaxID=1872090 RepID=UPI004056675A
MKVFIDVSVLTLATFVTGIQRVTREITVRLIGCKEMEIILLHYNAADNAYYRIDNQAFVEYYTEHKGIKEKMITKEAVPVSVIGQGCVFFDLDAAWMCRMKRSYLLPILKAQGTRIVAHIYDIISITHPQYCLERGVYNFMDFLGAHLQYADDIIVNAQATVDELEKLPGRIGCKLPACHVVPLGADFRVRKEIADEDVNSNIVKTVKENPYILMVGTIEPRKNHKLLLEAYDKGLKELGYNIIMAGYMGWDMEEFQERLHHHPDYGTRIHHFEGLDDNTITYLYQNAKFLVFCSYTEGFGLPIIEAIQRGTPVLAADVPVLREVGGDYCVWFEQDSVEELIGQISYLNEDAQAYRKLKEMFMSFEAITWKESYIKIRNILVD